MQPDMHVVKEMEVEAASEAHVEIAVMSIAGDCIARVTVERGDTVAVVEMELARVTGIQPVRQCLIHGESQLQSTDKLSTILDNSDGNEMIITLTTLSFDSMIQGILNLHGTKAPLLADLPAEWIIALCDTAQKVFLREPALLEIVAPVNVISHIAGDFFNLLKFFERCEFPPTSRYIFLGNYSAPYGQPHEIELLVLLLAYKVTYPDRIWLLRGMRECGSISRIHGFYDVVKRRYAIKLWKRFVQLFDCMPMSALINDKIFCVSGGISPQLTSFDQIRTIGRPTDVPDSGLLCDLLWADPDTDTNGWSENDAGVSYAFGSDVASAFVHRHALNMIICGRKPGLSGYEYTAGGKLLMLNSVVNYRGEHFNSGAIAVIDDALNVSFETIS